jgi:hypothetical protein
MRTRGKSLQGLNEIHIVQMLAKRGMVGARRYFRYPKAGRSWRRLNTTFELRPDPEAFVLSRVRSGQPGFFSVNFRNTHAAFILVTANRKVFWLDQNANRMVRPDGENWTGQLRKKMSRYLDRYLRAPTRKNKVLWYAPSRITELRFRP